MGLDAVMKNKSIQNMLIDAAPALANILLSKIPGLDLIAPQITQQLQDAIRSRFDQVEGLSSNYPQLM